MKAIEIIYETQNGKLIKGDNLDILATIEIESVDSCISDFPYDLGFMGKKWDNTGDFYSWNKARAEKLYKVLKSGGYVAIFGHPKTNHRMKCAFEDVGFKIVEEIDWIYLTGMPKNQDIGKLFDKKAGAKREVVGENPYATRRPNPMNGSVLQMNATGWDCTKDLSITAPSTDLAKQWNGWKTSGLKPAHEPITIFQKPLDGTYIQNIEKHGCGAMNIDACRVPISQSDIEMLNAKSSKNTTTTYSDKDNRVYGKYAEDIATPANELGRFPSNVILDEFTAQMLDYQTGEMKSGSGNGNAIVGENSNGVITPLRRGNLIPRNDTGGGSRIFTIIKYNQKVSPKERILPNGERNPHVTLKPIELIKWLIKLLTPADGTTIDITAGSCTHGVACEELNKSEGYNLKWFDIELMNSEKEPYCDVGKMRIETVISQQPNYIFVCQLSMNLD